MNENGVPCSYEMTSKRTVFLLSYFTGIFGIDYCVMARGNACYSCLGATKGLTLGGLLIWAFFDWILILADQYTDGNGAPFHSDM